LGRRIDLSRPLINFIYFYPVNVFSFWLIARFANYSGLGISSFILAFILGLAACFTAFIVGADFVLAGAPAALAAIMKFLGLGSDFNNVAKGVIDTKDLIFYFSFIFLFLWLNVRVIERRAWK